ncbi:MAG: hypothetical protein HY941_10245 [Gammaproteobacteria bacterium]|nr:hypothetical protein [Gammaproteobacteria bacterium]
MELTESERDIFLRLPEPPTCTSVKASKVWIVEWLPANESQTGRSLYEWMQGQRKEWAAHYSCRSKGDLIHAIAAASDFVSRTAQVPILHIDAHGGEKGLVGPDGNGGMELLSWGELIGPLQILNTYTGCNLLVFLSACLGYAAVQIFSQGPRASAIAIIGPDSEVMPSKLLEGGKEFYRRIREGMYSLEEILDSASREMGGVKLLYEPVTGLTYEAWISQLIASLRSEEQAARKERVRCMMARIGGLGLDEIEVRLNKVAVLPTPAELQALWDMMFMIDLFPENAARFGLDMGVIHEVLVDAASRR